MKTSLFNLTLVTGLVLLLILVGSTNAAVTTTTTISGNYTIVKFNGTGSTTWTAPNGVSSLNILIVGGAGGGGQATCGARYGGGGGAGGLLNGTLTGISGTYTVVIGDGGAQQTGDAQGYTGQNSSFGSYVTWGGGGGGGYGSAGLNGGSGGGGGHGSGGAGTKLQTSQSPLTGYGNNGGAGGQAGGGGGAGGAGSGQTGGTGFTSSISGSSITYAIGGTVGGADGTEETGSGGGGAASCTGKKGGSGIIILKYLTPPPPPTASFAASATSGNTPLSIQFTDTSTQTPTNWKWQWGDGTANGTTKNPVHIFTTAGSFIVNLTATNECGSGLSTNTTIIANTAIPANGWGDIHYSNNICGGLTTSPATLIGTDCATLNGVVSNSTSDPVVWFIVGTKSGGPYGTYTQNVTPGIGGAATIKLSTWLTSGQTYYYRIVSSNGRASNEQSFIVGTVTPLPTTTFGQYWNQIESSNMSMSFIGSVLLNAWGDTFGGGDAGVKIFLGIVIGAIFTFLMMRQEDISIPLQIAFIVGIVILGLVAPEFVELAYGLFIVGIIGFGYSLYRKY